MRASTPPTRIKKTTRRKERIISCAFLLMTSLLFVSCYNVDPLIVVSANSHVLIRLIYILQPFESGLFTHLELMFIYNIVYLFLHFRL